MISIAIPSYTNDDLVGLGHLSVLFNSVELQKYKEVEIVISDHSLNNHIELFCKSSPLNVKYLKNDKDRGYWCSNLNNAIKNCSGYLIKFMLQDDFFITDKSLTTIVENYNNKKFKWAACGALHTRNRVDYYDPIIPRYNPNFYLGVNTLGGPSCLTIENNDQKIYFDSHLNWMGDCDYYIKCKEIFGDPHIIKDPLIAYTQWNGQFSNTLSSDIKSQELLKVKNKYEKR